MDIICILDISDSVAGEPLDLVKESLKYLLKFMSKMVIFALVTFSNNSQIVKIITKMTQENKN